MAPRNGASPARRVDAGRAQKNALGTRTPSKPNPDLKQAQSRSGRDNPAPGRIRHDAGKSARPTAATLFSVYAGRDRLGAYCRDGKTFTAFTRLGRPLGVFDSEQAAIAAIDPEAAS